MAADLHIHIADNNIEKDVIESFKRYVWSSEKGNIDEKGNVLVYDEKKVDSTPNVWIGEVSWLKAGLLNDSKTFVPSTVQAVYDAIAQNLPVITDKFIEEIIKTFNLPNKTTYKLADPKKVEKFLKKHKGKKAYTISW